MQAAESARADAGAVQQTNHAPAVLKTGHGDSNLERVRLATDADGVVEELPQSYGVSKMPNRWGVPCDPALACGLIRWYWNGIEGRSGEQ